MRCWSTNDLDLLLKNSIALTDSRSLILRALGDPTECGSCPEATGVVVNRTSTLLW